MLKLGAFLILQALGVLARAQSGVGVVFERVEGPAVRVTVCCPGEDDGTTRVGISESWGGIDGAGEEIHDLVASDDAGRALEIARDSDHRWSVAHEPGSRLTIRYELRPEAREPLGPGHNDYRNVVRGDLFQVIGNHALVLPERIEARTECSVAWEGFGGWVVASSLGPGDGPRTASLTLDDFRSGFFLAGAPGTLRLATRAIAGNTVGVAVIDADWGFGDGRFLELVLQVVGAEREFFDDHSDPWFLVALTPNGGRAGERGFSFGGTGLTNCFALYCNTGLDLSPGGEHARRVHHLLAHEYFHTWNGRKIRIDAPEGAAYWFSEGFTEFYARRLLRDAGLWSDAEYLQSLNESVAGYDRNPMRTVPNTRVVEDFWNDRNVGDVPYRRGDMLALALDEAVRERSAGEESLDDIMRDLHRRSARGEPALTPGQFYALIAERAGEGFAAVFRDCVETGAEAPLPAAIEAGRLTLTAGRMREGDDGFDVDASRASGVVSGVREGTGAHGAGLRDGQQLVSIERLPPEAGPARLRVVTRQADGTDLPLVFEAVGEPHAVRRYGPMGG